MNFKEIGNNGAVEGFAVIKQCEKKMTKNGSYYLDLVLSDKDGEIFAKLWDYNEDAHGKYETDMFINFRIGQSHTLTLRTRSQQESTHRCCHANADRSHIALNVLHGIIDSHTCGYTATGAVDIKLDILIRILCFQIQQLRHDQRSGGVIDFLRQEDNTVIQQTGKNIIAAFTTAGLLNNIGY